MKFQPHLTTKTLRPPDYDDHQFYVWSSIFSLHFEPANETSPISIPIFQS